MDVLWAKQYQTYDLNHQTKKVGPSRGMVVFQVYLNKTAFDIQPQRHACVLNNVLSNAIENMLYVKINANIQDGPLKART